MGSIPLRMGTLCMLSTGFSRHFFHFLHLSSLLQAQKQIHINHKWQLSLSFPTLHTTVAVSIPPRDGC